MIGQKFNKLTVMSLARVAVQHKKVWNCVCDCGRPTTAWTQSLTDNRKTSCGCDKTKQYTKVHGRIPLTAERLRQVMRYDRVTGALHWLVSPSATAAVGDRVGFVGKRAHRVTSIDGKMYRCARLCWMHVTGEMPKSLVDHHDTDRANDAWDNLRLATSSQNNRNCVAKSPDSGLKGAYRNKDKNRWFSSIRIENSHSIYLGSFDTKEQAHAAYVEAAKKYHGEFARFA